MRSSSLFDPLFLPFGLACIFSFASLVAVSEASQPTCYWEYLNRIDSASNDGPCAVVNGTSGPVSCCSSGDTCIGNNICRGPGGSHPNGSGYYLSGCTDSTLSDASCTSHCASNGYPDIRYNVTTGLWACCTVTNFNVDCSNPTSETFSAPAPAALSGTFIAHSSTASSSSTSTSTSTTSTSSSSTSSTSSSTMTSSSTTAAAASQTQGPSGDTTPLSPDPLSAGAKAGIAITIVIALLIIFGVAITLIRSRRRAHRLAKGLALQNAQSGLNKFGYGYAYGDLSSNSSSYTQVPLQEAPYGSLHELQTKPTRAELSATLNPVELGGWDNSYGGNYRLPKPAKKHDTYYHP